MREIRTSGSPSGDWKRGLWATAPVVDSTKFAAPRWSFDFPANFPQSAVITDTPLLQKILWKIKILRDHHGNL
jgi:hypothetical protein